MSGRKNLIPSYKLLTAQSLGNSFQTTPTNVATANRIAFNVATSGVTANIGTFGVQHRMYQDVSQFSAWNDLTLSAVPTLANADVTFEVDVSVTPGQVRLIFSSLNDEVQTLTFPTKAASTDGDYVVITDGSGVKWAVALDKTGGAANTPTGAAWTAVAAGKKVYTDISAGTTASDVAAIVETALNSLTGFTAAITTDDAAANGTMTLTMIVPGDTTNPSPHNKNDSGVGSILGVQTSVGNGTCDVWISGAMED